MILTGRYCQATERRFNELKVDFLFQGINNKADFLLSFIKEIGYVKKDVGYIPTESFENGIDKTIEWIKNGGEEASYSYYPLL